jgi:hypothetical protein
VQWCWGRVTLLRTHCGLFLIGHACWEKGGGGAGALGLQTVHALWSGSRPSGYCAYLLPSAPLAPLCPSSLCPTPLAPYTPVHLPLPVPLNNPTAPRYLKFISLGGFKHVLSVLQNWGSTFVVEAPEATPPLRMSRSLSNASEASADLTEGQ